MNTSSIVQKLWNYCNGPGLGRSLARSPACEQAVVRKKLRLSLRDDGMSYGDYVDQLTYLLFLKMADERTTAPYNQKNPVPEKRSWPRALTPSPSTLMGINPEGRGGVVCDGDALFDHYRHTLEALGLLARGAQASSQKGLLGLIFSESQNTPFMGGVR